MKKNISLFLIAGAMVFSGCGKDRSGTYSGQETLNQSGVSPQTAQVTLQITSGKSDQMTGSYSSSTGNGSFSGTVASDGNSIQNVSLSMPQAPSTSTVNGVPTTGCGGTFTGTLTIADNKISGILTLVNPAAPIPTPTPAPGALTGQTGYPYSGSATPVTGAGYCAGATRSVNLSK